MDLYLLRKHERMSKEYPIETKSIEELVSESMEYIIKQKEMSEEEEIEDDAEHGYFQNEEE